MRQILIGPLLCLIPKYYDLILQCEVRANPLGVFSLSYGTDLPGFHFGLVRCRT